MEKEREEGRETGMKGDRERERDEGSESDTHPSQPLTLSG